MKKIFLLVTVFLALNGCAYLTPWMGYPVSKEEYVNYDFIGKRYEVIAPLKIMKSADKWGDYFIYDGGMLKNKDIQLVREVPLGAIIRVDHVSRSGGACYMEANTAYIGKFETPGIFDGGFDLSLLIKVNSTKEKFLSANEAYLKELP